MNLFNLLDRKGQITLVRISRQRGRIGIYKRSGQRPKKPPASPRVAIVAIVAMVLFPEAIDDYIALENPVKFTRRLSRAWT